MFQITSKVKIAAGVAAGALVLGAAGAYAAANNNNTISIANAKPVTVTGGSTAAPALISLNGTMTINAANFTSPGDCVSTFATNKDLVLKPTSSTTTRVSKNYHGKLMSTIRSWCQQFKPTAGSDTQTTDTQTTDTQSGAPSGHGHGHGHNPTA